MYINYTFTLFLLLVLEISVIGGNCLKFIAIVYFTDTNTIIIIIIMYSIFTSHYFMGYTRIAVWHLS